jgi:hypothetical protein
VASPFPLAVLEAPLQLVAEELAALETVGDRPAVPTTSPSVILLPTGDSLGQVDQELVLALLLEVVHHAPGEVVPRDRAFGNRLQLDASLHQRVHPIARLDAVEPAEAILIPANDHLPAGAVSGVAVHPLEVVALLGGVAGDAVVDVPHHNLVAVILGVSLDLGALFGEALFLLRCRSAQVSRSGDQSGRLSNSHEMPFLRQRVLVVRAAPRATIPQAARSFSRARLRKSRPPTGVLGANLPFHCPKRAQKPGFRPI